MQEIKKRRIVIASVLKPVDDTRMFEKIGKSLASIAEVYVIGYPSKKKTTPSNPRQLSLSPFPRISIKRMLMPWTILVRVSKIRPFLFILTTHELLFIGVLAKALTGCKLIYDVQENYYRNISFTPAFPKWVRQVIARYVRWKENVLFSFIDHFTLAERAYVQELKFPGDNKTVIENKFLPARQHVHEKKSVKDGKIHLLFSGTLAGSTGVFEAVALAIALHRANPKVHLTIIGYCSIKAERERLVRLIVPHPFIQLAGGDQLVPYEEVLTEIYRSDFGIISYPPNPSTYNSIPTKLYEYLGTQLPILLIDHPVWKGLCEPYNAAITFRPDTFDAMVLLEQMLNKTFYSHPPDDVFWNSEAARLLNAINSLGRDI